MERHGLERQTAKSVSQHRLVFEIVQKRDCFYFYDVQSIVRISGECFCVASVLQYSNFDETFHLTRNVNSHFELLK